MEMNNQMDESGNERAQILRPPDGNMLNFGAQDLLVEQEVNDLRSCTTVRSEIPMYGVKLIMCNNPEEGYFATMSVYFNKNKKSSTAARCSNDGNNPENEPGEDMNGSSIEQCEQPAVPSDVPLTKEKNTEDDPSQAEQTQITEQMEDQPEESFSSDCTSSDSELSSENSDSDNSTSSSGFDSRHKHPEKTETKSLSFSGKIQNVDDSPACSGSALNPKHPGSVITEPSTSCDTWRRCPDSSPNSTHLSMDPPIWKGTISLKNGHADVDMRLIAGSTHIATACLLTSSDHTTIQITQKIPINEKVFEERHIKNDSKSVTLIALPSGECRCHFNRLQAFQNFFSGKKLSGAVICEKFKVPGVTYMIRFLPKFALTVKYIRKLDPVLAVRLSQESYLVIIIEPM